MQSPIIKHLHIVFDDERYDFISQALFEEDQSSYAAIPVLKRMNRFKPVMKIQQIIKSNCFQFLIVSDSKPAFSAVSSLIFQEKMELPSM